MLDPGMICHEGVPSQGLSSLLSVTVSAARLPSDTGDTAAADRGVACWWLYPDLDLSSTPGFELGPWHGD